MRLAYSQGARSINRTSTQRSNDIAVLYAGQVRRNGVLQDNLEQDKKEAKNLDIGIRKTRLSYQVVGRCLPDLKARR
eukprot:m.363479 g.363479  ORF g.363479 m.363479 type:complete len:77 (-) comp28066_c1_seq1:69-299(-)